MDARINRPFAQHFFDPQQLIQEDELQVYQLSLGRYVLKQDHQLDQVNLGVVLWDGVFEGLHECWLRWCDADGILIPTGEEGRIQERHQVEQEHGDRADQGQLVPAKAPPHELPLGGQVDLVLAHDQLGADRSVS